MVYNFTVADYHTYYVTDLGIWVHNTNCGLISSIDKDKQLAKYAKEMEKDVKLKKESEELIKKFLSGDTNPGSGNKFLFNGIYELRSKNGARVYFRMNKGSMEILAKSNKKNQDKVIKVLKSLYGK